MARVRPVSAASRPTVTAAAWALALALALVAVALPAPAAACRCRRPTLLGSYFASRITSVVIATPQRVVSVDRARRTYGLLGGPYPTNTTVYKGCPRKLERFSVYGSGSSCSTTFALGVPVLLFLTDDRFVGPCDYTVPASELTAGDVAFLARRAGCGSCVAGNELECYAPPCSVLPQPCAAEGATCTNNYCGGCRAEWLKADGTPLTCTPGGAWGGWAPSPTPTPVPTNATPRPGYGGGGRYPTT